MELTNVYEDTHRADSYAKLEFPGTYYLAYRDIPSMIQKHVSGSIALDFGCGTGRSTRFLKGLGFDAIGVDISADMISHAVLLDPGGEYRLIVDGNLNDIEDNVLDLVLAVFTFDNIRTIDHKIHLFKTLREKLKPQGKLINLVSSPDIYINEWVSFTTIDFPDNWHAKDGDKVKIVMTDVEDKRPVEDILCTDTQYRQIYAKAQMEIINVHRPLGRIDEHIHWKTETRISPWCIYILR